MSNSTPYTSQTIFIPILKKEGKIFRKKTVMKGIIVLDSLSNDNKIDENEVKETIKGYMKELLDFLTDYQEKGYFESGNNGETTILETITSEDTSEKKPE